MTIILHITKRKQWERAQIIGTYRPDSLDKPGFIHCSTPRQIVAVANIYFHGQRDLVLLCIEAERVAAEVRFEDLHGGEEYFPHIYGPLNLDAVVKVIDFWPDIHGSFRMPEELADLSV